MDAAGRLPEVVRAGRSGTALAHGRTFSELLEDRPDLRRRFDDGMSSISRMDDEAVAAACELPGAGVSRTSPAARVVPAREILRRNPGWSGVLFEQPPVLAGPVLLDEYVREGRARLVPGNLFEVLPAPADVYVIKGTLQVFADRDAVAILRNCAGVMRPSDKLSDHPAGSFPKETPPI